jgi:heme-degrading monooxygenase HmoA
MTTIGMHYDVVAGKEEEFERAFVAILAHLKGVAGHVESHLYREVQQSPGTYVILSDWENAEAFEKFVQSPQFRTVTAWGKSGILRGRPKHRVFRET